MTSLIPGIAHRLQLCQYINIRSFLWESQTQHGLSLHSELSHQDAPGIITDVLGTATNVLSIIMDLPRSIVHPFLYRNLAGRSVKITAGSTARTR